MKTIPILRSFNMKESIDFYTHVLDFRLQDPNASPDEYQILINGNAELILTSLEGDQRSGINVYIRVDEIDNLFKKYVSRGLKIPNRPESPVHNGPLDQTWDMREFYADDLSGNTLRFGKVIE
jgi:hypothetical protein